MCTNEHPATTRSVVADYFHWRLNETSNTTNRLFYIVRQIATECEAAYHAQELRLQFRLSSLSLGELEEVHCEIAKELFSDGVVTWTRIITLIAFSAMVTARLIDEGQKPSVMSTAMMDWTTNFIETNLHSWLESQNYWVGGRWIDACVIIHVFRYRMAV